MNNVPQAFSEQTFQNFLNSCENFLFDCDGVVWNWPSEIPGSVEFINRVKQMGKKCFFVTNNSTRTRETFSQQLKDFGVKDITKDEILSTAWVLAEYLKSQNFNGKVYLVGNPAMVQELDRLNIKHNGLEEHKDYVFNSTNYNEIELDPTIKCVSVGIDYEFTFQKMIYASSYLKRNDCIFVATNDDSSLPVPIPNIAIPDAGPILSSIEKTTGKKALVIGKPRSTMWEILCKVHGLDATKTCMIGDRLDTDILFAFNAGIEKSVLVLSGITKESDMQNQDRKKLPMFYADSLGDLLKFI
ncbi:Phosphoglycolate phosphatase [Brachionus plicatilis]|uniref:Phosphoglycolate phosphatase n=1 Tax=Brachionus plicatilis TaxID=10195 RepID=A0A3M7T777_BRAPC|nr:Phosphoglycolate phosphatase [Brachionus plicatilis]